MAHEFVIMKAGVLVTYTCYDDIPNTFDHVIKFLPEIPNEPHTAQQHSEITKWPARLAHLMEIEHASSN